MKPPKLIHFIWAGGDKPFPNNEILKKWQEKNSDCQLILWVDFKTTSKRVFDQYKRGSEFKDIKGRSYQERSEVILPLSSTIKPPIIFVGISTLFRDAAKLRDEEGNKLFSDTDLELIKKCIDYEMNRFHPNYGSSSDLLRCLILATYGSAYFDSDIDPGKKSLTDSSVVVDEDRRYEENYPLFSIKETTPFDFDEDEVPQIKFAGYSQRQRSTVDSGIGNDSFLCSPKNKTMVELTKFLAKRYQDDALNNGVFRIDFYDNTEHMPLGARHNYRIEGTIERTGPGAVTAFLRAQGMAIPTKSGTEKFIPRMPYFLDPLLYEPHAQNQQNWAKVPIKASKTTEEAMIIAVDSMVFESAVMGFVRFAQHVEDINRSLLAELETNLQRMCAVQIRNILSRKVDEEEVNEAFNKLADGTVGKQKEKVLLIINNKLLNSLPLSVRNHLKTIISKEVDSIYSPENDLDAHDALSHLIRIIAKEMVGYNEQALLFSRSNFPIRGNTPIDHFYYGKKTQQSLVNYLQTAGDLSAPMLEKLFRSNFAIQDCFEALHHIRKLNERTGLHPSPIENILAEELQQRLLANKTFKSAAPEAENAENDVNYSRLTKRWGKESLESAEEKRLSL